MKPLEIETELRELIERDFPPERARLLAAFADRLFARGDSVDGADAGRRLRIAARSFEFFLTLPTSIAVRVAADPEAAGITIVETATADCPFIVDSLHEYFHALGVPVRTMLHPVFKVARDAGGQILSLNQAHSEERAESFVHAEIEITASSDDLRRIEREVRDVLAEVSLATGDFSEMTARALEICHETARRREVAEAREFLRWLVQGGFVFLGYRRCRANASGEFKLDAGSELGILRDHEGSRFSRAGALKEIPAEREGPFLDGILAIGKTRVESIVHRRSAMDAVSVRREDGASGTGTLDLFLGLFTSKAYAEEAQHIPVLRAKLAAVLDEEGAVTGSHDFKDLVTAFNTFPKDELFRAPVSELREQLRMILDVKGEASARLKLLPDVSRGSVVALVVMPREAFSAAVRMRIQDALAAGLRGKVIYYYLALGEGYTARLHFCFAAAPPAAPVIRDLEATIIRLARTWEDRILARLVEQAGPTRGREIAARWKGAFTADYQTTTGAARAAKDVIAAEKIAAAGRDLEVEVRPHRTGSSSAKEVATGELRMIGLGEPPMLSDLMPMLRNFGLDVLAEDVHEMRPIAGGTLDGAYVQVFSVRGSFGSSFSELPGVSILAESVSAVRGAQAEDDSLNALTPLTGLAWREVALIRAYVAAAFQMQLAPSRDALRRVLLRYPYLTRNLFELFTARLAFDDDSPAEKISGLRAEYLERLTQIDNLGDDRVARALLAMVEATVRTNFFCASPPVDPHIALKFASGRIAGLPGINPLYEIHVNGPKMEGCHLRAGKIARGGIRFSDRPDDYRTEILDLMKTQTLKNALIVPTGAKGGFIVKQSSGTTLDSGAVISAYRTLISAMLDLTDSLSTAGTAHPPGIKVLDDDGPYLVVAADKGTAS
ncbi:MAG TPA: NAD-glutamate dehydrogenase domain-containing protein, partial [Candidatus Binataceae bacterium]|nr:NAD-glutamate dehydrogenase domain-containing protein [Candidatus Binataceae bacterium]